MLPPSRNFLYKLTRIKFSTLIRTILIVFLFFTFIFNLPDSRNQSKEYINQSLYQNTKKIFPTITTKSSYSSIKSTNFSSQTSVTPQPKASYWKYENSLDKMRNSYSRNATIISENSEKFDFPYDGESHLFIILRDSPKFGKDVILIIDRGQFSCSFLGCTAYIKFDNEPIMKFNMSTSDNGNTNAIFFRNYNKILTKLKKSKKVIIEVNFYNEGFQQFHFYTDGLEWK